MIWKGNELKTNEDLMARGIDACENEAEAQDFILQYVGENVNARFNIGYLAGYYSREDKHRIFRWFDVDPIFGSKDLEPDVLMGMGMMMAANEATSGPKVEVGR